MNTVTGKGRPQTVCTLNIPLGIFCKLGVLNNMFQKAKKTLATEGWIRTLTLEEWQNALNSLYPAYVLLSKC